MKKVVPSIRIFINGAWLAYIGLFNWTTPAAYTASKILMPLASIIFFTFLGISATGSDSAEFYIIGNSLQIAAINGIYGVTMSVGQERNNGTLIYILGTPANRLVIFLGRAFFHIIDGMIAVVFGFFWGVALLGLDLSGANLPGLALTILIATWGVCGLGLLMGSISLMTLNVMFINNTVYFLLLLFSGANIAISKLPAWMQKISELLPLSRGITAARELVSGANLTEVSDLLIGEILTGGFYALVGFSMFAWFEIQAKRRGTLEAF